MRETELLTVSAKTGGASKCLCSIYVTQQLKVPFDSGSLYHWSGAIPKLWVIFTEHVNNTCDDLFCQRPTVDHFKLPLPIVSPLKILFLEDPYRYEFTRKIIHNIASNSLKNQLLLLITVFSFKQPF